MRTFVLFSLISIQSFSQVGINTTQPTSTLNVVSKDGSPTESGFLVQSPTLSNLFIVKNSGKIGINTSDPKASLEVNGTFSTSESVINTSSNTVNLDGNSSFVKIQSTNNGTVTVTSNAGVGGQRLVIYNNSTTANLDFYGYIITSKEAMEFVYSNNNWIGTLGGKLPWSIFGNSIASDNPSNFVGTIQDVPLRFRTKNLERMKISKDGNIGIGCGGYDASEKLEIRNGNLLISNDNNESSELKFKEPSGSGDNFTSFKTQAQIENIEYTLPESQGSANSVLTNDGTGKLAWGTGNVLFQQKSADESVTNSTSLQDDNDFTYTLAPNKVYEITGIWRVSCTSTGSLNGQFSAPAGSTSFITVNANRTGLDDTAYITDTTIAYDLSPGDPTNKDTDMMVINGTIKTGATGGVFKFKWAQKTANSTATTIYKGSYLKVTMVTK